MYVLRISLIHVYYLMYFYYVLLFIISVLLLDKLEDLFIVNAQVRDLCYNSGNLYPNCIIRHMLTKWPDHPPGICRWGVRMVLKGLGIRKCVSSGLASCMFTIRCISIIFCCLLFICYHWISLRICSCISAWVWCVASQVNSYMYVRLQVSGLESGFPIRQLLTTQPHILALLE